MKCPHGYCCFECPEGDGFDCDYELSEEEISNIEKMSQDSSKFVGKIDIQSQEDARRKVAREEKTYKTSPERRSYARAYRKIYYQKHKAEIRQKAHEKYVAEKKNHIAKMSAYQKENPEKHRKASLEYYYRQKEKVKNENN